MPHDPTTPLVQFKLIEGSDAYRVGDDGSIWSRAVIGCRAKGNYTAVWRRLKSRPQYRGHMYVNLGRSRGDFVHRLVLEAFRGPCPKGEECRHLDGDPSNNRLDNLAWGTRKQNGQDRVRHGTSCKGEAHTQAKLTEDAVRDIVKDVAAGLTQKDVAMIHGVSQPNIQAIMYGRSWTHITGFPKYEPKVSRPRKAFPACSAEQRETFDRVRVVLESIREGTPLPD